ncbi:Rad52/Rad22 family DNA repair protein [Rhodocaloribacter sp.]
MSQTIDLERLRDFFDPSDIGWKPIALSKKTGKALVAAYVSNRAIMDRLDAVCGPGNWRNEFTAGPKGGLLCGLSIRIVREDGSAEWVTKWDGAENTDVEPVKGGLSSSMRRAAV